MNGRISRWLWESGRKLRSRRLCRLCRLCQRFSKQVLLYPYTGKTAGVQDSKGFEKDVPLYYLLGDYDSDYDKYTDLEGAAEAMKEYPHEVYLMTIDTGYAA